MRWLRSYPFTLVGVALFLGLAAPFLMRRVSEWDDVFVKAAVHLRAGEELYDPQHGYAYPPFMALLAVPFSFLPPHGSRFAFYLVNAVGLLVLCRCAWRVAGGGALEGPAGGDVRERWICLLGLACAFRYALDALAHQQTDLVIGALVLGGCCALLCERAWSAATCFGLAAAMKCTPLLWCLYLAWRRQWLPVLWLVAVAVGVNLLPDLVSASPHGGLWAADWVRDCLLPKQGADQYPGSWHSAIIYNQSLSGLGQRWLVLNWAGALDGVVRADALSPRLARALILGSEVLLLALAAWVLWRRRGQDTSGRALEFSVVLLLMLLLSPMSSKPHFCTLLLPAFCLARLAVVERRRAEGVLLALAILAGTVSIRGLMGVQVSSLMLWWGMVTWSTLFLLAGCFVALSRPAGAIATRTAASRADRVLSRPGPTGRGRRPPGNAPARPAAPPDTALLGTGPRPSPGPPGG